MKGKILCGLIIVILATSTLNLASGQIPPFTAELTVTKTGTPAIQPAPGTITWSITVENTGDVTLTGINVTDSRHGVLGSTPALAPGGYCWFTIVETSLPAGMYLDEATAWGYYAPLELTVSDTDSAECCVGPSNVIPEIPLGTIMASTAMIIGLACFFCISKTRNKKNKT